MTPERLQEIAARAMRATPGRGQWWRDALYVEVPADGGEPEDEDVYDWENDRWVRKLIETDSGHYPPREADRELFANAREDILELVAEIERLHAASPVCRRCGGEGERLRRSPLRERKDAEPTGNRAVFPTFPDREVP